MVPAATVKAARRTLLRVMKAAGLFRLVAKSRWRTERLLILGYHGVSIADEHEWNNQLYVPRALLRARFEILRRGGYSVLPLDIALSRLVEGRLPPRSVAITFDDGAHDFYEAAFPLLREFGFPATVYQTTYYCEVQRPVFDTAVAYVLWRSRRGAVDLGRLAPPAGHVSLATDADRRNAALAIRDYANRAKLSAEQKDDLLRAVAAQLGVDYDAVFSRRLLFLMTPDEVREVAASGIDVELHTHRHRTPDDCAAFVREIDDNRASLDRMLGPARRRHFCYPSGVYRSAYVPWLRRSDVSSATTCEFGLASRQDHHLLLPRFVDTGNISPLEFEAWLAGVGPMLPHRRNGHRPVQSG